ncbi:IS91 family transposase [Sedimenticola hydrogenitrophicus]|uniref:IS91 family transposase n=1 Tax=Sedimenticola hydrogenitrophicus TaxID=2967975 RepID=UPI0023AF0BBE|nr:IS91 family transposase [Sedimenticola hydrogenitrophicus]
MNRGLQQVLAAHLPHYCATHRLDTRRARVCEHILQCRTKALGGYQLACDRCDHDQAQYFACRDRHCPLCQQRASRQWAETQQQAVLPATYYHLVFTLPDSLNGWVQLHPDVLYRALFAAVWQTLKTFGADPKRLGGQLGMTAVLHTWGQTLTQHVHLHCLVPGGVLTDQGSWKAARSTYLFPVRALSRHFRGCLVSRLRALFDAGQLPRVTAADVSERLDALMAKAWVVFSRPCETSTDQVIRYLARYSHRTAISNQRILAMDEETVSFRYQDYGDADRQKVMHLSHMEFIRRFLLHVLPQGLMRIRHFGYLANCCRAKRLAQIRVAIAQAEATPVEPETVLHPSGPEMETWPCPACRIGRLRIVGELPAQRPGGR